MGVSIGMQIQLQVFLLSRDINQLRNGTSCYKLTVNKSILHFQILDQIPWKLFINQHIFKIHSKQRYIFFSFQNKQINFSSEINLLLKIQFHYGQKSNRKIMNKGLYKFVCLFKFLIFLQNRLIEEYKDSFILFKYSAHLKFHAQHFMTVQYEVNFRSQVLKNQAKNVVQFIDNIDFTNYKQQAVCYFIYLKIRISLMKAFVTPPKEICNRTIINSMPREGDWICFSCNNLNFAFRKKCNRCKFQTREQNQQYVGCYQYSFDSNYPRTQSQPLQDLTNLMPTNRKSDLALTPKKKSLQDPEKDQSFNKKLPSVSPLVKKYAQTQKNSQIIEKQKSSPKFICSPLCWETQWPNTSLQFFNGFSEEEEKENYQQESAEEIWRVEYIDYQIQEMITRIIL